MAEDQVIEEAVVVSDDEPKVPEENAAPGGSDEPKAEKPKGVKREGKKEPKVTPPKTWGERTAKIKEEEKVAAEKRKAAAKGGDKPPRERDPDVVLGHKATALATGGSVSKEGVLNVGERKFGAACNATQVKAIKEQVKGKSILQLLGNVSERALKQYAQGDIKASELPDPTKKALKELNAKFPPKMKMWPRKDAAILFVLHQERKANAKPKAAKKETVAA